MEKKQINIAVGRRIKANRERAGLTQEKFSEMLGIGDKHLSAIERGAAGVSLTTLTHICTLLSISADSLLFDDAEKSNDVAALAERLARLSPDEYATAEDVLNRLLAYFAKHKSE